MEEALWNGIRMLQPQRGFRLGTDSVLLAEFLSLPPRAKIADLGAGCATLGLLLCARDPACTVAGLELRADACALAQENIALNALQARLSVRQGDVRNISEFFPAGSFSPPAGWTKPVPGLCCSPMTGCLPMRSWRPGGM